jgi:hypothetical protein
MSNAEVERWLAPVLNYDPDSVAQAAAESRPQGSDRRNRPGVTPVTRRKFAVKWLWLEKPAA